MNIKEFRGQYFYLSNFFPVKVEYKGHTYLNAEAAFHACKCPGREKDFENLDPSQAKRLGRHVQLRQDWETVKDKIMYEIVLSKFTQHPELMQKLIKIDGTMEEGNTWGDRYWGVCDGQGKNKLGHILMRIRDEHK